MTGLSNTFQDMAQGDALLTAIGLTATGGSAENRTFTGRIPVGGGTVRVREVRSCGNQVVRPGLGTVTVVVYPNAPGGGDLTLSGTNYSRNFTATSTFHDVPAGNISLDAREVVRTPEPGVTAIWTPDPRSWTGPLSTFAPIVIRVSYSEVPGTLQATVSGLPQGASGQAVISGRASSSLTIGPGTSTASLLPGSYTITFPDIWADDYSLYRPDPSSLSFKVSSRQVTQLSVSYRLVGGEVEVDVQEAGGSGAPVDTTVRR